MITPDTHFLVANWKMKPATLKEGKAIAKQVGTHSAEHISNKVSAVICPPALFLSSIKETLEAFSPKFAYGGQNIFPKDAASKTGENSPAQLSSLGAKYLVLGHSERRGMGETNSEIAEKILSAFENTLIPIICVGEKERDAKGEYLQFLEKQIKECFVGFSKQDFEKVIIAYEPLWAIGKDATREATPAEIEQTLIFIKKVINDMTGNVSIGRLTFLYGGSVDEVEEVQSYMSIDLVKGFLVGRASLDGERFGLLYKTMVEFLKK